MFFTKLAAPPFINSLAAVTFPWEFKNPALFKRPLVANSKVASVIPETPDAAKILPVDFSGSSSNSSSNLLPATLVPKAIKPPAPVAAATNDGADLNAALTALKPACE